MGACEVSLYKQLCLHGQSNGLSECAPIRGKHVGRKGGEKHRLFSVPSGRILESQAAVQGCGAGIGKAVEGPRQRTPTARDLSRRGRR